MPQQSTITTRAVDILSIF